MLLCTPAKINLFLNTLRQRPDGFHDIESIFQTVSLYDWLHLQSPISPQMLTQTLEFPPLQLDFSPASKIPIKLDRYDLTQHNLLEKVYKKMEIYWQKKTAGYKKNIGSDRKNYPSNLLVTITKNIPVGAGLGGGSSNAAALLIGLNAFWNLGFSLQELETIALAVGSDVPFFLKGGLALVTGQGEKIEKLRLDWQQDVLLVTPAAFISTPQAYRENNTVGANDGFARLKKKLQALSAKIDAPIDLNNAFKLYTYNSFEKKTLLKFPNLKQARNILTASADFALLSGSGSSLFGIFHDKIALARSYLNLITQKKANLMFPHIHIARFVDFGVCIVDN